MKTTTFKTKAKGVTPEDVGGTSLALDEDAYEFLQDVFINLYSAPWKAILREYTSNALDAHIAGQSFYRPVEVILPQDSREGKLIIRDFGIGMSEDELRRIYSKIGASTKRNTNTQVGGFGFGGKSALSEVSEFFITSIKRGLKVEASVRKTEGSGALYINSTEETTEPDGTTITIPAAYKERQLLEYIEGGFFVGYSNEELVVKDSTGNVIRRETVYDDVYSAGEIVPNEPVAWLREISEDPGIKKAPQLLIGGVVYPVDSSQLPHASQVLLANLSLYRKLYINVPVGSVKLTPSREALNYKEQTKDTIAAVLSNTEAILQSLLEHEYGKLDEPQAALRRYAKDVGNDASSIKNSTVPLTWKGIALPKEMPWTGSSWNRISRESQGMKKFSTTHPYAKDNVSLYDFLNADAIVKGVNSFTDLPKMQRALRDYIQAVSANPLNEIGHILTTDTLSSRNPWLAGKKVITVDEFFEVVKARRRAIRAGNARQRELNPETNNGSEYWVFAQDGDLVSPVKMSVTALEALKVPIYYVPRSGNQLADKLLTGTTTRRAYTNSYLPLVNILPGLYKDGVILFIEANRSLTKFKKELPDAIDVMPTIREDATRLAESLNLSRNDVASQLDMYETQNWSNKNFIRGWTLFAQKVVDDKRLDEVNAPDVVELFTAFVNRSESSASNVEATKRLFDQAARLADPARIAELRSKQTTADTIMAPLQRHLLLTMDSVVKAVTNPELFDHILQYMAAVPYPKEGEH